MPFPEELRLAIDRLAADTSSPVMSRAAVDISAAYRAGDFIRAPLQSAAHRIAYLQVRMPATYAACHHVFEKISEVLPDFQPRSLLDLGAGPGTAAWAALEQFPSLERISLVERDGELLRFGKALATEAPYPALRSAQWGPSDLRTFTPEVHDVIVLSYALGELNLADARRIVLASRKASKLLVLIEPGTPKAFARMAELRTLLIAEGATLAAPCPHERLCPLLDRGDWCHFAERLQRTAEHRRIKGGSLGYEDEKFSYLAATSLPVPLRTGRIVRHPQIHSGYVQLQICATDELQSVTITKSQKEIYRAARKSKWGDRWQSPR